METCWPHVYMSSVDVNPNTTTYTLSAGCLFYMSIGLAVFIVGTMSCTIPHYALLRIFAFTQVP